MPGSPNFTLPLLACSKASKNRVNNLYRYFFALELAAFSASLKTGFVDLFESPIRYPEQILLALH